MAIRLTSREEHRLRELLPDQADMLIQAENIVYELDGIVYSLLDKNQEPTDESRAVERLMDDINWRLFHPQDSK